MECPLWANSGHLALVGLAHRPDAIAWPAMLSQVMLGHHHYGKDGSDDDQGDESAA
jgi:hypothetical protein